MVSFNFTQHAPSEQFYYDFQALNSLSTEQLIAFSKTLLKHLEKAEGSEELAEAIADYAAKNGVKPAMLRNPTRSFLIFLKGCVRTALVSEKVKEDLLQLGLSEDRCETVAEIWKEAIVPLSLSAVRQILTINELIDLEWTFGVTASSDEVKRVGTSFLRLKLVIDKGDRIENEYVEMSLEKFYEFLHEMEKARACLRNVGAS